MAAVMARSPAMLMQVTRGSRVNARCFSMRNLVLGEAQAQGKVRWQIAGGVAAAGTTVALLWKPQYAQAESAAGAVSVPPFTMDAPKYDQSTFYGRLMGMYEYIDPRTLFISSAELKKSQNLLETFKASGKKPEGVSDAEMWEARRNVEVSIHPVTGEVLFLPGRMSAFVPMNVPLCALMLMASTPTQTVFAQWLNQTYNVVNNYVNRSGATVDWGALLQSYGLAVTASCSIALGASKLMKVFPSLQVMGPFVPYLAVISAGSANVSFTRMEEWQGKGISVCDAEGNDLGMSKTAGQLGVMQTVLSRSCFLPIAPMVMPVLAMKLLKPFLTVKPVAIVAELVLITGCISGMLPVALSILPQKMEIDVKKLEPEFQNLKDSKGQPITTVFANKGL
eukprot:TRINITY_DN32278_c0_g1_i1.p1 TRINITY_DN32278_c0_g1~~TRINITY_DN32278_c0_g1_i1.p1  ORF type:complete len:394 (-),score=74.78 TRINITY_DN32278_c0_g1_i1:262-1443(-)